MAQTAQAFAAGGGRQPPGQSLGMLYSVGIFGQPQPGCLYHVECIGFL